jgi:hypothetical protein
MRHLLMLQTFLVVITTTMSIVTEAATFDVTCPAANLQTVINGASDGDTIRVRGTCNENIFIATDKDRLRILGLDGATIQATSSDFNPVHIRGRLILLNELNIQGGHNGVNVERGGSVMLNRVTVEDNANFGIAVTKNAYATIINSTIQSNVRSGILVGKTAHARIGFRNDKVTASEPNLIQANGDYGIVVNRSAAAEMVGNTIIDNGKAGIRVTESSSARIGEVGVSSWSGPNYIQNNRGPGILVEDVSFAEIKNNQIEGNGKHGVVVKWNSSVTLENNDSLVPNTRFGVRCNKGGAVRGSIGGLTGAWGATRYSPDCIF